jgi:hypothetical protein
VDLGLLPLAPDIAKLQRTSPEGRVIFARLQSAQCFTFIPGRGGEAIHLAMLCHLELSLAAPHGPGRRLFAARFSVISVFA